VRLGHEVVAVADGRDDRIVSTAFARVGYNGRQRFPMEIKIIGLNFVYAVLGVILMFVSYRVIDWLTPQMDFPEELKKGNVAVAIFIAALFIAISIIIGHALN
jgi:hypothetical protein